ncbi:CAMK family protein kinase [Tritrichomonas foetus]|uniref:CAMK family protein kinase n=1 Tax=Tritrichomonas foetus TaxID=1144522 RepID=A0A1J4JI61_9EUKA|nr:CAMK family protein kinase [Tritrichomonas foetus]|eukprot:OHS97959.1 CAMK family protein kinase [Tritrichomonas foetus]
MLHISRAPLSFLKTLNTQPMFINDLKQSSSSMKKVNQFVLVKKIGSGSTSKVYVAKDTISNHFLACKVFHLSRYRHSAFVDRLEREIRIMRILNNHSSIISLNDVLYSQENDTAYMFMELADCGSLEKSIQNENYLKFSDEDLSSIFKQVVEGLIHLHSLGIVHHDVKPANIMLFSDGSAKLADFDVGHSFESCDDVVGSPAYQAPEIFNDIPLNDDSDDRTDQIFESDDSADDSYENDPSKEDVWSLGVSLYEAAFGRLPFGGYNMYEVNNEIHMTKNIVFDSYAHRSDDLIDLIRKMLVVDNKSRISMEEVRNHPFFARAPKKAHIPVPQIDFDNTDIENSDFNYVSATICDENFSFARNAAQKTIFANSFYTGSPSLNEDVLNDECEI